VFGMEIKTFRIKGKYRRQGRVLHVSKDIREVSLENALERFYSIIGSHGVKRADLIIEEIKEIDPTEISNERLRKIALLDKPTLVVD